ncbi:MAG: hypothetical protein JW741_12985 [Sedimentisphaerales bacterium]|nr:hypothetical protein [Sedimentisphaerales bacterium]
MLLMLLLAFVCGCSSGPEVAVGPVGQFPSPMADAIRGHGRVENEDVPGVSLRLKDVLSKPVEVFFCDRGGAVDRVDLLVHFHGAGYVARRAAYDSGRPFLLAVVNLGSGSSVYERAFQSESAFDRLAEAIRDSVSQKQAAEIEIGRVYLSSFSAGYGAVRAILKSHASEVDGIVLLDGLHTDYVPPRQVLAQGGKLNDAKLKDFVAYARRAMADEKKLLITHSEIFPGTYASTTETADYLIGALDLQRHPVLQWGPVGMQMLTETRAGGLTVLGFAGNTAPDHIDHLHGLPAFLKMLLDE